MPYQVNSTALEGVLILEPKVFGDARGFFFESFNSRDFLDVTGDRKSTRLNSSHMSESRMPSSA